MDDSTDTTKKASTTPFLTTQAQKRKTLSSLLPSTDKKEATLTLSRTSGGDYSLVIKGVKDVAGNAIVEVTVPFCS